MTEHLARHPEDQPNPFAHLAHAVGTDVCGRCGQPVYLARGTDNGQPWESWQHREVADEVFCGLVMQAADRLAK